MQNYRAGALCDNSAFGGIIEIFVCLLTFMAFLMSLLPVGVLNLLKLLSFSKVNPIFFLLS